MNDAPIITQPTIETLEHDIRRIVREEIKSQSLVTVDVIDQKFAEWRTEVKNLIDSNDQHMRVAVDEVKTVADSLREAIALISGRSSQIDQIQADVNDLERKADLADNLLLKTSENLDRLTMYIHGNPDHPDTEPPLAKTITGLFADQKALIEEVKGSVGNVATATEINTQFRQRREQIERTALKVLQPVWARVLVIATGAVVGGRLLDIDLNPLIEIVRVALMGQ